jgi:type IV pilus assembly protein PilV
MLTRRHARGDSLVEALVALVLLSLGLLALAGAQTQALGTALEARQRAVAMSLAAELAERMLDHPAALRQGGYQLAPVATLPSGDAGLRCRPGDCPPDARVADDLTQWRIEVGRRLPAAEVAVVIDPVSMHHTLWIGWSNRLDASASECLPALPTRARCVRLQVLP